MTMEAVWIEINNVPLPNGFVMLPGQAIELVGKVGTFSGAKVRFEIFNAGGGLVFGPVEDYPNIFTLQSHVHTVAPMVDGVYTLVATEMLPLFPDNSISVTFGVSVDAPPPPAPPPDGGFGNILSNLKWIVVAGAAIAGIVIIAPAVMPVATRVGRSIGRSRGVDDE